MSKSDYVLEREYVRASTQEPVWVRITYPVKASGEEWTAYVHFYGLDEQVVPVTQSDFFDMLLAAADIAYHRLAPIEHDLIYGDLQGSSFFPRQLHLLVSKETMAKVEKIIEEDEPKHLRTVDISKLNPKPY
jgi:hypothetical protein